MNKKITLSICLIGLLFSEFEAQTKYWVKFNNKNGTPYTLSNPTAFLTNKSVQRRFTRNVNVDATDLPVTPSYVAAVDAVPNTTIHFVSKWINGVVVSTTSTLSMNIINTFSFVSSYTPVNKYKLDILPITEPITDLAGKSEAVATSTNYHGGSYWQNKQLNVDCIHAQGYRGQGMTIAVLDAGFNNVDVNPLFDSLRTRGGILGTRDFVTGGNSVYEDDSHGQAVLSCMAAIKPYVIYGSAPMADYWLLRTEDAATEKIIEEYNWIRGAEFADSVGADILTTSLGYTTFDIPTQNHTFADLNGNTSNMSIAARMAASKVMLVLNAAGNGGGGPWPKIGIPADADKICTVGAIDSLANIAGFSSVGPTADGRIKPDLVSRGALSYVSNPNGTTAYSNGTSFATPILAGAMACFWQAHKPYNSSTVLDTLKHTATFSATPNNIKGWGVPNMCAIGPFVLGVKEQSKSTNGFNFDVMPNPFNSNIKISLSPLNYTSINIQIVNTIGAVVKSFTPAINTYNFEYDFSELTSGFYFIKISTSLGTITKKVIKQ
jgi:hypothetical protein